MTETVRPTPEPEPETPAETAGAAPAKKSYPMPATVIICLLILLGLVGGRGEDAGVANSAESIGFVMGWALGGATLWLIAWFITIRHASRAWKWGSFAIVIGVGLLTGLARIA